jgi:hypothetical protein
VLRLAEVSLSELDAQPGTIPNEGKTLSATQPREVGIRGRDVGVAKDIADDGDVRALLGQLDRESVPESVRMHPLRDLRFPGQAPECVSHVAVVQGQPLQSAEDAGASLDPELLPACEPCLEEGDRSSVQPNRPPLTALAPPHRQRSLVEIEILRFESKRLRDAEPTPPQDADECAIPDSRRCSF